MMSGICGRDTNPELAVRRIVHGFGSRFFTGLAPEEEI
jgi:G:T-mismatch repair DNA endonuclease (very short patch repair protein)